MFQALLGFAAAIAIALYMFASAAQQNQETEWFKQACHANGGSFTPASNPDDNACDLPKR
jgi:hypothetical protein